uniref:Uncharacterized protein n=1 Tax=Amphora coffeiformis TaxID=265554 RepID=A0A7S3L0Z1_9STRA|mmetsp:Transcript_13964/g.26762  ORF Transcript_13964/g.26762 Transcript_13964/m.26762 type:complete len:169 (-) Transcript_13964:242-748(-)|eukprot:scaffold1522_cov166-Amphora_coffeaeformis.AAC.27
MAEAEAKVMSGQPMVDPMPTRVRFGSVKVRKHPMTLGDNPGGIAKGPPITMDWEHVESEHFSTVDGFLEKYPSTKGTNILRLSGQQRREIVSGLHTDEDIAQAEQEIKMIRLKRQESADEEEEGSIKSLIRKKQAEQKKKKEASSRAFGLLGSFSLGRRRRAPPDTAS